MGKKKKKLQTLAQGISVLSSYIEFEVDGKTVHDWYLCPLCMSCAGTNDEDIWTLEHLPLDCAGGQRRVVICHSCNNGTSKYDNETHYSGGSSSIDCRSVEISEKSDAVIIINGQSLDKNNFRGNVDITTRTYTGDLDKASRSHIKSAILALFVNLGYCSMFHPEVRALADFAIGSSAEYREDIDLKKAIMTTNKPRDSFVMEVRTDEGYKLFLTQIHEVCVLLPHWGEKNINFWLDLLRSENFSLPQWSEGKKIIKNKLASYPVYKWDKEGCPLALPDGTKFENIKIVLNSVSSQASV